jgi:hypothetical protein
MSTQNMKIHCNKTKSVAMVGREQRRVNIVIDGDIIEQESTFKYLGGRTSIVEMKADL